MRRRVQNCILKLLKKNMYKFSVKKYIRKVKFCAHQTFTADYEPPRILVVDDDDEDDEEEGAKNLL